MTQPKISRRDTMKLLGAALGGAALANIPSKWNTPRLISGILPAHAQTSSCALITRTGAFGSITDFKTLLFADIGQDTILAKDTDACDYTRVTFAWDGDDSPAEQVGFQFTLDETSSTGGFVLEPGTKSPAETTDISEFLNRDLIGIGVAIWDMSGTWNVGNVTVTFS